MDTTATNKRIREIVTDLEQKRLIPNPNFQRRLVWSQKHKAEFIRTIQDGLPFPEIYIAAGEIDVETGRGHSMLVDGQQRVSTIYEYFKGSPNLSLPADILPYTNLDDEEKRRFLEYKIVVRDLGDLERDEIINVFERINSTSYSLNAVEISNARYDNDFKRLAESLARLSFWEEHSVFRLNEVKRMQDLNFLMVLLGTFLTDYFNRDDRVEEFLIRYNDGLDEKQSLYEQTESTLAFLDELGLPDGLRAWQRADLFTLIVELHRAIHKQKQKIDQNKLRTNLEGFYRAIGDIKEEMTDQNILGFDRLSTSALVGEKSIRQYYRSTTNATNDRGNRIQRGAVVREIISSSLRAN